MATLSTPLTRRAFVAASAVASTALLGLLTGCGADDDNGKTPSSTTPAVSNDNAATNEAAAPEPQASDSLGLITPGTLTVGSDCDYPPFIWMDGEQPCGFEYDLLTELCKRMDLELKYLPPQKFDTLVPSLVTGGKMDVAVSSVTVTDARLEEIDFTDPYCDSNQSIAIMKDSDIASRDDLAGKTVAVHSGTTGEEWAKENLVDSTIVPYDDQSSAFAALAAGKADAFCEDLPIAQYMIAHAYPECVLLEEVPTGEQYAIAVSKDNPALTEAINEALQGIVEDGTYDELYASYFSSEE